MKKRNTDPAIEVDVWNLNYPVGTPVLVRRDDGTLTQTVTTHEASILGGHTAVVWLKDIRGAYALERVSPFFREAVR